jgi:serine/threonine protein kinase
MMMTAKNEKSTRYGRGTQGYRAPELVAYDAKFSSKSDIWALGIFYELLLRQKAFRSNWDSEYKHHKNMKRMEFVSLELPETTDCVTCIKNRREFVDHQRVLADVNDPCPTRNQVFGRPAWI